MKGLELLEAYPKASELVVKYYSDKFTESIETSDAPEEFKEFAKNQTIDAAYVANFIDASPRSILDVFDEYSVYIQISLDVKPYENVKFNYSISGETAVIGSSLNFATRIEAEREAIERAFEILNNKL